MADHTFFKTCRTSVIHLQRGYSPSSNSVLKAKLAWVCLLLVRQNRLRAKATQIPTRIAWLDPAFGHRWKSAAIQVWCILDFIHSASQARCVHVIQFMQTFLHRSPVTASAKEHQIPAFSKDSNNAFFRHLPGAIFTFYNVVSNI